jgi:nucleotide-binding universal stress UspA family protein
MLKPIRSILFATDLSQNCQQALEYTIGLGTAFHAMIYMLHVIEPLPENVEGRLKDLLGKHQWQDLINTQQENVRKSLLGKRSFSREIRDQIITFCKETGIDEATCEFQSREIIISDGEVVEDIIKHAKENECDLIVMGAPRGIFSHNSIGSIIKGVLKGTKIPVTIVPSNLES